MEKKTFTIWCIDWEDHDIEEIELLEAEDHNLFYEDGKPFIPKCMSCLILD